MCSWWPWGSLEEAAGHALGGGETELFGRAGKWHSSEVRSLVGQLIYSTIAGRRGVFAGGVTSLSKAWE